MPVKIRKSKGGFRVSDAGKVTARHTSKGKGKAERQARLLRAVAHGWRPTRKHR